VDTILVKVVDPVYMGYCIEEKVELGNNVFEKIAPDKSVQVPAKFKSLSTVISARQTALQVFQMADKFTQNPTAGL
jgi:UDP-N-acetylglucosamine/UDP-N-acetylgalactosamine diphosphorylase